LYTALFMLFLAAGFIGVAALAITFVTGPKKTPQTATLEAYEAGIPAAGDARERFPIHFYLVAMLFIIFDLETAFFYPLAVRFQEAPQYLFWNALVFVAILGVGYVYVLRRGVLDWR
jgi:NADH-quinone oxidoreductase subunit A